MKIIAYFLPQYHEIEENNEWWGKGFTEWINVKNAKSLYNGHNQPRIPLNNKYYDLMEKETVKWQTELSIKYGIDGFCYYHYWFNGRKILEKPAENLINWVEIPQNFCFCWANHDWRKTWNGTMELLIKQEYGDEEEWEEHFQYLIKFFKDSRYIKIKNKPIFMIFLPNHVKKIEERIQYLNKRCIDYGFDGIFIVENVAEKNKKSTLKNSSAVVLREPSIGWDLQNIYVKVLHQLKRRFKRNYLHKLSIYKFNKIAENSLKYSEAYRDNKEVFMGSFTSWDSTPRHGRRGYVIGENNPEDFKKYLIKQKKIMKKKNIEYLFINAWNEWGEGMYLEPDEKNGYRYLEIIKEVKEEKC